MGLGDGVIHPKYRSDIQCPPVIQESIRAYVEGRPTGGFLRAVLENDLIGAVCQADHVNRERLPAIIAFVLAYVPPSMRRSPGAVAEHLRVCAESRK